MDLFDMIGPMMIGPSSSHTAGAARIGLTARMIMGEDIRAAHLGMHGSFAKTYQGHGTDRAIVGGLMGMAVDDPHLRNSLEMAAQQGMEVTFTPINLRGAHPNTVRMTLTGVSGKQLTMEAASVGGGNIAINKINDIHVDFTGKENTLIIHSIDTPGVIANITSCLSQQKINIATVQLYRRKIGQDAMIVLELDSRPSELVMMYLRALEGINSLTFIERRNS